jgi:hypothetical protein
MRISLVFLFCIGLSSCSFFQKKEKKHLVSIYDNDLYFEDVESSFQNNISAEDSLQLLNTLVEKWVKKQILIQKAKINLEDELMDVEKQVQDYKNSLLIYKYQNILVQQKLDTLVSDLDLKNYYVDNKSNFKIKNDFVQINYVKVKKEVPNLWKLLKWYKSEDSRSLELLEDYCYQFADEYSLHSDWIVLSDLMYKLPNGSSINQFKSKKYFELKDENFYYFVYVKKKKNIGDISPFELEKKQIKTILINKRKLDFLRNMENQLYKEVLSKNLIKYEKE